MDGNGVGIAPELLLRVPQLLASGTVSLPRFAILLAKGCAFFTRTHLIGFSLRTISEEARMRSTMRITKNLICSFRVLSVSLLMLVSVGFLHAEGSDRTIGQFVHTAWSAKDGAPGSVYALAQTRDGFLWLGTMQGLYRFDGVSFERYEPQSGPPFQSYFITSLLALPDGDLWIGFHEKGVSRLRDGRNTNYTNADGLPSGGVVRLVQDREGAIWAGTNGGLARFEDGRWQRIGDDWGYPGAKAAAVYVDRHGTLWVATENTVVFLLPGSRRFQATGTQVGQTRQFVESPDGTLWMAETTRSVHPLLLPPHQHGVEPEIRVGSNGILFDGDGSLWITSLGDGMRRVPFPDRLNGQKIGRFSNAIESFTSKDGPSSDYAICILKDREGSIWVGTSAGLDRFRKGALVPILLPAKFTKKTLVAGDHGDVWVGGMSDALARIEGDTRQDVRPTQSVMAGFRDSHGTIWFLTLNPFRGYGGDTYRLFRVDNGRLTKVAATPAQFDDAEVPETLAADRMGRPWLGSGGDSLFFLNKNRHWQQFDTPLELAGKSAVVGFADGSGHLWFGFTENSIMVIDGTGTGVRTFSAKDGIQVGSVMAITGRDPHIWIGGEDGLAVWEGDRFRAVVPADGDRFHGVSGIQEDSGGDLFLSEDRGVVFIPATEVSKTLKDRSARVQYQLFDVRDGVPGAVQQTTPYPTSVQGTDGRIWFSTSTGVAWIDPAHMPKNLLAPPITIRSITANGTHYTSPAGLRLPPRTRDLMIDYTALSLAVSDRVRFRYKLEGSDMQWQDAGVRRQAFYTNLSPREYRFRVIASNNDGVWNEAGASLSFVIAPTYYQTTWFRALFVVAFLALVYGAYRFRVRQLRRQEKKLRDVVETIPTFAWTALPDGAVDFINHHWVEYTGLSTEKTTGSGWEAAVHAADSKRHAEKWRASLATGEPFENEVRYRRAADQQYRWFLARAVPLRDQRGKILKWYGITTDIEDRKRAEEEREKLRADLAHVNRVSTLGEMAASLAHEIKQPIAAAVNSANSCIEWLAHEPPNLDRARAAAVRIDKYGNRAAEIIDRIRSFYRKSPPQRELVEVNGIVHEILVLLRGEATRYGVSIRTDLAADIPEIAADLVQLQQVLMNLVLNAIEAMKDSGGELTVKSESGNDGRVRISVSDTGVGLPAGKVDEIFSAFFTTKPQGSGMGLAISRSIVESHGGRLWATANHARGATFHVTLPIAAEVVRVSDTGT